MICSLFIDNIEEKTTEEIAVAMKNSKVSNHLYNLHVYYILKDHCNVIFALILLIITGEYNNCPYTKSVNDTCAVNSSFGDFTLPTRHGL